ncbi:MAG TPA: ribosomal protein S18-alanine N-acetyltransferase, partial [Burkholderiaceae bacterium]|nr:ribosomal protein S18-alanine N-acetyltransferase [Burkholderiaceae bacterium]
MSALPSSPQESIRHGLSLARMQVDDLPEVLAIENDVYPYPWTHGNFLDSLYSGYEIWTARDANAVLVGYLLLMVSVDEAHLLNIAVRRELQGQGVGRILLEYAVELARDKGMQSILLEVRPSNDRAVIVYERFGFAGIGVRKGYYPAGENRREDAIVM